jgi:hypothetical protein
MTQPTNDARQAVYSELMWPEWNPATESRGTGYDKAVQLLDAYRAEILREAADSIERDAGSMTRFFGHQIAAELRRMADEASTP